MFRLQYSSSRLSKLEPKKGPWLTGCTTRAWGLTTLLSRCLSWTLRRELWSYAVTSDDVSINVHVISCDRNGVLKQCTLAAPYRLVTNFGTVIVGRVRLESNKKLVCSKQGDGLKKVVFVLGSHQADMSKAALLSILATSSPAQLCAHLSFVIDCDSVQCLVTSCAKMRKTTILCC